MLAGIAYSLAFVSVRGSPDFSVRSALDGMYGVHGKKKMGDSHFLRRRSRNVRISTLGVWSIEKKRLEISKSEQNRTVLNNLKLPFSFPAVGSPDLHGLGYRLFRQSESNELITEHLFCIP